jgi:ABC-type arginine transport system ATPase subunit
MTDYAEKACHALSGGQKQRVAIAGLLAMQRWCSCWTKPPQCSIRAVAKKYSPL